VKIETPALVVLGPSFDVLEFVEVLLLEPVPEEGSYTTEVVVLLEIEVVLLERTEKELALGVYVTNRLVELTAKLVETEIVLMDTGTLLERVDGDEDRFAEDAVAVDTKMYALVNPELNARTAEDSPVVVSEIVLVELPVWIPEEVEFPYKAEDEVDDSVLPIPVESETCVLKDKELVDIVTVEMYIVEILPVDPRIEVELLETG
jgi:hypothetical protein